MKFVGREHEISELNELYKAKGARLAVVYGRRRVGKSCLIEEYMSDKPHLHFDGLENVRTRGQIEQFTLDLARQINEPLLQNVSFGTWSAVFDYISDFLSKNKKNKTVILFDEFQWLAVNQTKLVSLVKTYWDRYWSKQNVLLILCGSVSSYMIKRVVKSKALYGRINWELCLRPFSLNETFKLLKGKRSKDETMLYNIILGGIPKYLQEINPNKSFAQNINRLFFVENALLSKEYEKIFYSQFKEHATYEKIVCSLIERPLTLNEISKKINVSSGGGLKEYLSNLEKALFVTSYVPYDKSINSKLIKYKLTDEYLRFYFKYIQPHLILISSNRDRNLFSQLVKPQWRPWLGFAFENFCIKNAYYLSSLMGFAEQVVHWGPCFNREAEQFQADLVYVRQDKVITLCEIKYIEKPIGVEIVREIDRKCNLIVVPKGYTLERALISRFGADEALTTLGYFHHSITVDDFFGD